MKAKWKLFSLSLSQRVFIMYEVSKE